MILYDSMLALRTYINTILYYIKIMSINSAFAVFFSFITLYNTAARCLITNPDLSHPDATHNNSKGTIVIL